MFFSYKGSCLNDIKVCRGSYRMRIYVEEQVKVFGKPKLAAFSLIFSRLAEGLMGYFFAQEDVSSVFHPLRKSE